MNFAFKKSSKVQQMQESKRQHQYTYGIGVYEEQRAKSFLVLFKNFKLYTFMETPSGYIKKEVVHSYWFKTYSHPTFTELWELFYKPIKDISGKIKYKKTVSGELLKELNDVVLAF